MFPSFPVQLPLSESRSKDGSKIKASLWARPVVWIRISWDFWILQLTFKKRQLFDCLYRFWNDFLNDFYKDPRLRFEVFVFCNISAAFLLSFEVLCFCSLLFWRTLRGHGCRARVLLSVLRVVGESFAGCSCRAAEAKWLGWRPKGQVFLCRQGPAWWVLETSD